MRSSDLYSKEWCDLVFDGRNKDYGAYQLRRRAGRRYGFVLTVILGGFVLLAALFVGGSLYVRYVLKQTMREAQTALEQLRTSGVKEGYKVQFLATARMVPAQTRMAPGASQAAPVIVDGQPLAKVFGVDGPISYDPEQDMVTTPIVDTTGLSDKSLPIAKEKIVPTEVVSQMPQFPGGPRAFMQWLDQHIVYPQQCIAHGQTGRVELSFIVGTDGYATDFEVKDAFDPLIRRAALAALKSLPKWKPGTDAAGQPTPVKITVPVDFQKE